MKKHEGGSKRNRKSEKAIERKISAAGKNRAFMSMGLSPSIVKKINREKRYIGLDVENRKAS